MKRFQNILALVQGREDDATVIDRATRLARANAAQCRVLGVVPESNERARAILGMEYADDIFEAALTSEHERIAQLIEPHREAGARISSTVATGSAFLEVTRAVIRHGHDIVVTAGDGDRGTSLFGAVSMHLMRKCPCPVWVVDPERGEQMSRVLVAIEPSPWDEERQALNRTLLQLAWSLANGNLGNLDRASAGPSDRGELHVLHTWTPLVGLLPGPTLGLEMRDLSDIALDTRRAHEQWVEELVRELEPGPTTATHVLEGRARSVIPRFAEEVDADVVVMGTLGRAGVSGLLIGNTAEAVLQRLGRSVLAVKPEGFVTPVR